MGGPAKDTISFIAAIPWIVTAAVAFYNNRKSDGREARKEARVQLDGLIKSLDELEKIAFEYHLQNPPKSHPTQGSLAIKRLLTRISQRWELIQNFGLTDSLMSSRLRALRRAITLDNFDSSDFKTQEFDSPILQSISSARDGVAIRLEQAFAKKYIR